MSNIPNYYPTYQSTIVAQYPYIPLYWSKKEIIAKELLEAMVARGDDNESSVDRAWNLATKLEKKFLGD